MIWIIIIITILVIMFIIIKRSKAFCFDSVVMLNGTLGVGKTLTGVYLTIKTHKSAHRIWWRRVHIWGKIKPLNYMKKEEEPMIYSNIPIFENRRKKEKLENGLEVKKVYKYYRALTNDILERAKRPFFKSIIFQDESSLMANSRDANNMKLSEELNIWIKLVRHSLHGSYSSIFRKNPSVIITTQSKNDNHYAYDRTLNQVLYLTKSKNIPLFKIIWCRDLLLIDSVQNIFNDDVKEENTTRWYLIRKAYFKKYNSYCYSFLTDEKEVSNEQMQYLILRNGLEKFKIPTFHHWKEIEESNLKLEKIEKEEKENGEQENNKETQCNILDNNNI